MSKTEQPDEELQRQVREARQEQFAHIEYFVNEMQKATPAKVLRQINEAAKQAADRREQYAEEFYQGVRERFEAERLGSGPRY